MREERLQVVDFALDSLVDIDYYSYYYLSMKETLMTRHMRETLTKLAAATTVNQSGWHFGTLKALVARGAAETFKGPHGTEYQITEKGRREVTA